MVVITGEMIKAAQDHDRETRPQGSWGHVYDDQVRRLLEGALSAMKPSPAPDVMPSGPFTATEEWCVFWGGEDPGDCAGSEVLSCEDEALEDRQWRVTGGVARRSVLYGRWTVTVPPDAAPGTGCQCYRGPSPHEHDSDEDGDCLVCGCGRYEAPEPKDGEA